MRSGTPILGAVKHGNYVDTIFAVPVHDHKGQSGHYKLTCPANLTRPTRFREGRQMIDRAYHPVDDRLRGKWAGECNVVPNMGEVANRGFLPPEFDQQAYLRKNSRT